MRIIKLGNDEDNGGFGDREAVTDFFDDDLYTRKPVGAFGITKRKQHMPDLQRGTLLIFSYSTECMYLGRANGPVQFISPRRRDFDPKWPAYFVIAMSSLKQISTPLEDYESALRKVGHIQKLVRSRRWPHVPDSFEKLTLRFFRTPMSGQSAVDDLPPPGNAKPGRTRSTHWTYERDADVRDYVLRRARGRCEYCNEQGFLLASGHRYLEPHHIIALANEGEDTPRNVIAVCPNHHREAHFGDNAWALEREMIEIVRRKEPRKS